MICNPVRRFTDAKFQTKNGILQLVKIFRILWPMLVSINLDTSNTVQCKGFQMY